MTRNSDLRLIGVDAAATGETLKGGFAPAMVAAPIKAMFAGGRTGSAARACQHCRPRRVRCRRRANLRGAASDRPDHWPGQLWNLRLCPGLGDAAGVLLDLRLPRLPPALRASLPGQGGMGAGARRDSVLAAGRGRDRNRHRPDRRLRNHRLARLAAPGARHIRSSSESQRCRFLRCISSALSVVRAFGGIVRGSRAGTNCPRRSVAGDHCSRLLGQPLPSRCHAGDGGDARQLDRHARPGQHLLAPAASAGPRRREASVCGRGMVAANAAAHGDNDRGQLDESLRPSSRSA